MTLTANTIELDQIWLLVLPKAGLRRPDLHRGHPVDLSQSVEEINAELAEIAKLEGLDTTDPSTVLSVVGFEFEDPEQFNTVVSVSNHFDLHATLWTIGEGESAVRVDVDQVLTHLDDITSVTIPVHV